MKKCFIITPIGSEDDPIRRHIDGIIRASIRPALKNDFEVSVAHEMPNIGSITKQIISKIFESDLVVANLTHTNPNVMYELAFRHCVGKPTIQIAEKGTKIPFDIGTERTILYQNDSQGVLDLKSEIEKYISEIDFSKTNLGPIYDVLSSLQYEKLLINESNFSTENGSDDKDVLKYIIEKIDLLDQKVSVSNRVPEIIAREYNLIDEAYFLHKKVFQNDTPSRALIHQNKRLLSKLKYDIRRVSIDKNDYEIIMKLLVQIEQMLEIQLDRHRKVETDEEIATTDN